MLSLDTVTRIISQGKLFEVKLQAHVKLKHNYNPEFPQLSPQQITGICIDSACELLELLSDQPDARWLVQINPLVVRATLTHAGRSLLC
ncbi:conserved hypothetical protein [Coccidioides posadasii str. Silveira]|uniref:Uncharacterized protein n=1 Tax=Coccidioides posadasii (strain RMSCC 757 / Silveira) TaxID=443226 RepID=E9DH36_COCPS|nr:conserved hypothetical protein [Coccidioides posadasii str. Silveira]